MLISLLNFLIILRLLIKLMRKEKVSIQMMIVFQTVIKN